MKKQTLAAFTAATVAASVVVPVASANTSFTDVSPSSSHYKAIQNLVERGIIKGYEDNTYRPNATLTRGQAAKILANALQLDTSSKEQKFTDVPVSLEYIGAINALANKGIINGYEDGTFKPGAPLTRGQMSKIIVNAFGLEEASEVKLPFTDVSAQNGYKTFIQTLLNYKITEGTSSTTFSPSAAVKRGQMASFVVRAENAKQAPTEDPNTIQSTIVGVEEGKLVLDNGTYEVSESLQQVFAPYNAAALQKAQITATVESGKIVDVKALTITAQGTKEQPVILKDSASDAAASTKSIATTSSKVSFGGVVTVASNYVQFKGIEFKSEVILTSAVKQFSFNESLEKLTIQQDVEATINGTGDVSTVVVESEKPLHLNIVGTVSTLSFVNAKAAVQLGLSTKVNNIITSKNVGIESYISNYSAVIGNIEKVNGSTPTPPSVEKPSIATVTGKVTTTDGATVIINGAKYSIASNVKAFFSTNSESLIDADITATLTNGIITAVNSLALNSSNQVVDGKGLAVTGNLVVNGDQLVIKNLVVAGNVTITNNVKTSINFEKVDVKGKVLAEEEKAVARYSKGVTVPLVENPVTRLKIVFADSTVAYMEIAKKDLELGIYGPSKITTLLVMANSSITTDPDVVLPKLTISKGVTNIELNASIASVEIESNDDIQISGKGNFDQVKVNTDKKVVLKTTGSIKQLASDSANITLGDHVKVGKTTSTSGEDKSAKDMIENFEDVKDNVNVDIDDEEQYITAKVIPVEGKYGYVTLSVLNSEGATIKYRQVAQDWMGDNQPAKVGEKVPSNAIKYNKGDQFIDWKNHNIEVYKVDAQNNVIDVYVIDVYEYRDVPAFDIKVDGNILTIDSVAKPVYEFTTYDFEKLYISLGSQIYSVPTSELPKWSTKDDGIRTVSVTLPSTLTVDSTALNRVFIGLNGYSQEVWIKPSNYSIEARDLANIAIINDLKNNSDIEEYYNNFVFDWVLNDISMYYDHSLNEYISKYNTLSITRNAYIEQLRANSYTNAEDIRAMMDDVNKKYATAVDAFITAEKEVNGLFVEDYNGFPEAERLAASTTAEKIAKVKAIVNELPGELVERTRLLNQIAYAEQLLERFVTNPVNMAALEAAIQRANSLDENQYTSVVWDTLQTMLETARNLLNNVYTSQKEVDAFTQSLIDQIDSMKAASDNVQITKVTLQTTPIDASLLLYELHYSLEEQQGSIVTIDKVEHKYEDRSLLIETIKAAGYEVKEIPPAVGAYVEKYSISKSDADVTTDNISTLAKGAIELATNTTENGYKYIILTVDLLKPFIEASQIQMGQEEARTYENKEELFAALRNYYGTASIEEYSNGFIMKGDKVTKDSIKVINNPNAVVYEEAKLEHNIVLSFSENVKMADFPTVDMKVDGKWAYSFSDISLIADNKVEVIVYTESEVFEQAKSVTVSVNGILDGEGKDVRVDNIVLK
ncbi:S-layer homology domain-containing protein [Solibacillus sp. CAU 1738]|uniref:S-layer homology domain-containing protein n=1 Tax=Solibacillus sp. CAU 1738 TaxID=3140363 RepID=UPI003260DC00